MTPWACRSFCIVKHLVPNVAQPVHQLNTYNCTTLMYWNQWCLEQSPMKLLDRWSFTRWGAQAFVINKIRPSRVSACLALVTTQSSSALLMSSLEGPPVNIIITNSFFFCLLWCLHWKAACQPYDPEWLFFLPSVAVQTNHDPIARKEITRWYTAAKKNMSAAHQTEFENKRWERLYSEKLRHWEES